MRWRPDRSPSDCRYDQLEETPPALLADLFGAEPALDCTAAARATHAEGTVPVVADPNAAVNDLADRFWEGVLERDPLCATVLGDERFNDRWPDLGPDGRAADEAAFRSALAEARASPRTGSIPSRSSRATC